MVKVLLLLRIRSETLQNRVQNQRWIQKHLLKQLFMRLEYRGYDSAKKIKEISIEQADSMEQVEVTAERIAEVVQNNSAAAQETSATSEELTAQATTLSGMVSVFKLRQ